MDNFPWLLLRDEDTEPYVEALHDEDTEPYDVEVAGAVAVADVVLRPNILQKARPPWRTLATPKMLVPTRPPCRTFSTAKMLVPTLPPRRTLATAKSLEPCAIRAKAAWNKWKAISRTREPYELHDLFHSSSAEPPPPPSIKKREV